MTDEFSGSNVLKFSVLLLIVLHGSSNATVPDADFTIENVTGYHITETSEAFSSSPTTVARHGQMNAILQQLSADDVHSRVVNLVEAPIEVIGPRAVESGIPGKVEKKRESGTGIGVKSGPGDSGFNKGKHACVLRDIDEPKELKEGVYKVYNGRTKDGLTETARASAEPYARSRVVHDEEDEEYDNEELHGSKAVDSEDEDDDDDNDIVVDDGKVRRNLKRKARRHYRQGPKIWDQWGKWTSCSVSCGAGKLTRWRHCVAGSCSLGEKEAQLKTCTFSAC